LFGEYGLGSKEVEPLKFSEIERSKWDELKPYLDSCLLPVTGLTGEEQPWEATEELEYLRDVLDCVEIPYKGRVVTYPAFQYAVGDHARDMLDAVCGNLKKAGFRHIIVMTVKPDIAALELKHADLLLCPEALDGTVTPMVEFRELVSQRIRDMWQTVAKQGANITN
jgi:hypothetical protein